MSYQILIVDDDPDFREELSYFLQQYRIVEAANGDEALRLIRKPHTIDLVILDVVMPGTDGIEVLKTMKKIIPDLSVIILTGKSAKDVAIEALRGNADDYFEKPLDMQKLGDTISRILKNRAKELAVQPSLSGGSGNRKIEQAKQFLERNYDKMVSLEDVAAEVCLSPKYFSRMFKESTGIGFNEYKFKIRTKKAERLLKETDYSIHEIAEQFGYKNLESFIRLFKKNTGMTPSAYRKQQRKKSLRPPASRLRRGKNRKWKSLFLPPIFLRSSDSLAAGRQF